MDSALVEEVCDLLNGLGVVDDVQRTGVDLQPPLVFTSDGVSLVDHLKDWRSRRVYARGCRVTG